MSDRVRPSAGSAQNLQATQAPARQQPAGGQTSQDRPAIAQQQPLSVGGHNQYFLSQLVAALKTLDTAAISPDNAKQTFAVGLLGGTSLIVANRGVANGEKYIDAVRDAMKFNLQAVEYTDPPPAGLHAEMAIIRHVTTKTSPQGAIGDLHDKLEIYCIGKPVCPECAAWLNKYSIPHCAVIKDNNAGKIEFASGKSGQSGQWLNP